MKQVSKKNYLCYSNTFMKKQLLLAFCFFCFFKQYAQFQFTGNVNNEFKNATAYLSIVLDCNKKSLFFTENILQESKIDSLGMFTFKGDFLAATNRIYKIHIDNCNDAISDYKHLLNHCEDSKEILFIANNTDQIHFPLNSLSQVFCSIKNDKPYTSAIAKIETLQEKILTDLQHSKNDLQRKNIYKNHFLELQKFSKTFNEPLAELYTYHLYANEKSISREFYLTDLKHAKYYTNLLDRLNKKYPNTSYTKQFKDALIKDQYPLLKSKHTLYKVLAYSLATLLLLSLGFNIQQHRKSKKQVVTSFKLINYKEILTAQEQKVFTLMPTNSNKEIAAALFISLSTVKTHINNIYSKLAINSRKDIGAFFE